MRDSPADVILIPFHGSGVPQSKTSVCRKRATFWVDRLLAVLRKYFDDDERMAFLETVIQPDKTPGLRQGSPLSPLLLNLYLHHTLDRPTDRSCTTTKRHNAQSW